MTAPGRAAWITACRQVLNVLDANPALPLPFMGLGTGIRWTLYVEHSTPAVLAAMERALPCELTGGISEDGTWYELRGAIDGLPVLITALAEQVTERRVVGTQVTEQVEWVRLPAPEGEPA